MCQFVNVTKFISSLLDNNESKYLLVESLDELDINENESKCLLVDSLTSHKLC